MNNHPHSSASRDDPGNGAARWKKLYEEAMSELDRHSVEERITAALEEIAYRSRELENDRTESIEERQEMAEAAANLMSWRKLNRRTWA
jgi:hypothetical protein